MRIFNSYKLTLLITKFHKKESISHNKSPSVEEIEDEDLHPRGNVPPKSPHHILEPTDDDSDCTGSDLDTQAGGASHKKGPSTSTKSKSQSNQGQLPHNQ